MKTQIATALTERTEASLRTLRNAIFNQGHDDFQPKKIHKQFDAFLLLCFLLDDFKWTPLETNTVLTYDIPNRGQQSHNTPIYPTHHLSIAINAGKNFQELLSSYFADEIINNEEAPLKVTFEGNEYSLSNYTRTEGSHHPALPSEDCRLHSKNISSRRPKQGMTKYPFAFGFF